MKLLAIDGNSLINRAFYGIKTLSSSAGTPTNAVYGFVNTLLKLKETYSPDYICVCFDRREKTHRHLAYDGYKAQRKPMPEELAVQIPLCREVLPLMGISAIDSPGFEADDLLGTLARLCRQEGDTCIIATGDRDSLQFIDVGATVSLVITRMGTTTVEDYDEARFKEKYEGLPPCRIVDLKAIMGDASDNIPGVKGIGEKGAMALLTRFGSLDQVYENLDDPAITPSTRKKLEEGREMAYLSFDLAKGRLDAPVPAFPAFLKQAEADENGLFTFLNNLELRSLIKRLNLSAAQPADAKETLTFVKAAEIDSESALPDILKAARQSPYFSLCVNEDCTLLGLSIEAKAYVIDGSGFSDNSLIDFINSLLSTKKACLHNSKPLYKALYSKDFSPPPPLMDTQLAAYLLDPGAAKYTIDILTEKYLLANCPPPIFDSEDSKNLFGVTAEAKDAISCHAQIIGALGQKLKNLLKDSAMDTLLSDLELPLMTVLAQMEHVGVAVDKEGLLAFGQGLETQIKALENDIYSHAGSPFNIASPKQMEVVLFDNLGLKSYKKTKTGRSTDAEVLEKLKGSHPIIEAILNWRTLSKLNSTYVEGLTKQIAPNGRIHSTFHQTVTITGRLSSSEPNLQNIPIRTSLGSEIRRFFKASPGCVLIDADYSQIELRILAHIANDETMIEAFSNNEDIHTVTAASVFNVDARDVTPDMRRHAKAVNFGIVYGISAFSLADDIGVSVQKAKEYIDAYLAKYSGVKKYMEDIEIKAKEDGFVTTLYGRRRALPQLASSNHNTRGQGQRMALNTPIQGTAADIIKIAMINVSRRLQEEIPTARLILQVHDELIIEAQKPDLQAVCTLLKEEMEGAARLNVHLAADVSYGDDWYSAKE